MEKRWLSAYESSGMHEFIQLPDENTSLVDTLEENFKEHGNKNAFVFMDKHLTFSELDEKSIQLAAYLQSLGLAKGSRVAVMMPNILQYPVVLAGVIRAGYILVNINPLYTTRELEHQLNDSGAEALVIVENFAKTFEPIQHETAVKHVILASIGDMLGLIKGNIVNFVLRTVRKQVPAYSLEKVVSFNKALSLGAKLNYKRPNLTLSDTALLQYTGGTTGVSKGAELTHKNIIANLLQCDDIFNKKLNQLDRSKDLHIICALPLYHIFAFLVCAMYGMRTGFVNVLIPNPRDLPSLVSEIEKYKPVFFPAVNTLFNALAFDAKFKKLDHSNLAVAMGGGMAVLPSTAEAWKNVTGVTITVGYGLSETSPVATANPLTLTEFNGSIGIPLASTEVGILDDDGKEVALGERGEICVRGPQVMKGYWNRPEATAETMTSDNFFRTGDIGIMDEKGFITIVDRKKDMILVSGFNVYPNEIESVISKHPKVFEAAAIGVTDEKSGEVPKLFIVKSDPTLTEAEILEYADQNLTGYKRPKYVEFIKELPKSNVGKVLRKELR